MKPNWKKCAKEAWRRGYEHAVKSMSCWNLPCENPPAESGTYLCIIGEIRNGTLCLRKCFAEYSAQSGKFYRTLSGDGVVLRWMPLPAIPKDLTEKTILEKLTAAR